MSRSSAEKAASFPKIVILSPSAPPVSTGGISTAHFALYSGLKRRGYPVELFTFADFGAARYYRDEDASLRRFGSPRWITRAIQLIGRIYFWPLEKSFRPRIYQTGDVWKARAGARKIGRALRGCSPDIVIFPDQASPAYWMKKPAGQRWIQVSHHQAMRFVGQSEIGDHSLCDAIQSTKMERAQLRRCDACVAPSRYMAGVVKSFVLERPVEVISNLVEFPHPERGDNLAATRVFIPSGGSRFKGASVVPELIAGILAASPIKDLEFFISGELSPAQRSEIARAAPLARITAPGHLSNAETVNHLSQSKICVSPTWIENQSMALLEAKALGVPFAAFDVGGNRELVGPVDSVSPRGDVPALARMVSEILSRSPSSEAVWDVRAHNENALDEWVRLITRLV